MNTETSPEALQRSQQIEYVQCFSDLDYEVQDLISAIKQSEICLERWDIDEYDRQFHRNLIANCANQLRNIWYPESSN